MFKIKSLGKCKVPSPLINKFSSKSSFVTDDKVTFANSTLLDNQNQTVIVWAKMNVLNQQGFFFEKGLVNTQYSLFTEGTNIIWRHHIGGLNSLGVTTATYLNTTDYFMLAGTYNSVDKKIYINGVERATAAQNGTVSTNAGGMQIGAYVTNGYFFNGNIAVVAVYNRALSAAEVEQNFEALRSRFGI